MATNLGSSSALSSSSPVADDPNSNEKQITDAGLLLDAFQVFTSASSSLESAFKQLESRLRRLSVELAARNRQLKRSLKEKALVENYLKRILESLPCGVLVLDTNGTVTMCNPVASEILRVPLGKPGARRPGARMHAAAELESYFRLTSGIGARACDVEVPLACDGRERMLAVSVTSLTSAAGRRVGTLHIIRDITEVKALQEQNKRSERLSAMGEMAVELAHEIRNPLGGIELFASLLEQELPRQSDPARWAENIRIGSKSLNNIVSNMLHFANPHAPALREVDAHGLIGEVLRFTDPIMRQREVEVHTHLEAEHTRIAGDDELLKQMLLNLILNSLQAMPSRGSIHIATRNTESPAGGVGDGIELRIGDTGLGIPPENLSRVFDPYFTTNKNGTGLGLSVVHQIVKQHSGFVAVESEVDVGTTFHITLPIVRQACHAGERKDTCPKTS